MEHLIQRMGIRISTVVTWLSKDCLAMSRAFPTRFQLRSLAAMRREYVGARDEPQSETTLLLPALPIGNHTDKRIFVPGARFCSITAPRLESTVAALAFNRLAQETFEKHNCADSTHPDR